jgi:hypothetical protein
LFNPINYFTDFDFKHYNEWFRGNDRFIANVVSTRYMLELGYKYIDNYNPWPLNTIKNLPDHDLFYTILELDLKTGVYSGSLFLGENMPEGWKFLFSDTPITKEKIEDFIASSQTTNYIKHNGVYTHFNTDKSFKNIPDSVYIYLVVEDIHVNENNVVTNVFYHFAYSDQTQKENDESPVLSILNNETSNYLKAEKSYVMRLKAVQNGVYIYEEIETTDSRPRSKGKERPSDTKLVSKLQNIPGLLGNKT